MSFATFAKRAKSIFRLYAEAPAMMSLGLVLVSEALHRVVVDLLGGREAVAHDLEPLAAHVERHAVREVAAFGQAHAHDRVAGLDEAEEHRLIRLRAGVGLDVGELRAEELLAAVDRELLGDVDELAAAVVALAGIALGVLVGELAALRRHDRRRRVVLRRDELDVLFLAAVLALDHRGDLGVDVGERESGSFEHGRPSFKGEPRDFRTSRLAGQPRRTARPTGAAHAPTALPGGRPPRAPERSRIASRAASPV